MTIDIDVKGMKEILRNIESIPAKAQIGAINGVKNSIIVLREQAISNLEGNVKNANPRSHGQMVGDYIHYNINKSWEMTDPEILSDTITMNLYNYSDHAAMVEFGTGERSEIGSAPVVAKGDKPLTFKVGPTNKDWVKAWVVHGQFPKSYLRNAIETSKTSIPTLIGEYIMSNIHV